jgi:NhaP-type Na+/H+ or K+/H+ antiporter
MIRGLLRRSDVPPAARTALGIESGLNDVVLLPIVILAMAFMGAPAPGPAMVGRVVVNVLLLGPLAGVLVGFVAVQLLALMRKHYGMRRDYESLYVLGVAFSAFAAAESLHASGFMAAFSAGLTVALLDVELCDCFRDYGEATSEMFLLFAFVIFGLSLIWTGLSVVSARTLGFAAIALVARSLVLLLAIPRGMLDPESRRLVVWFGPRGLSSLLLVLLPVFAGVEGAENLFPVTALVVVLSVVVHGGMLAVVGRGAGGAEEAEQAGESVKAKGASPAFSGATPATPASPASSPPVVRSSTLITFDELAALTAAGIPYTLLDVRKEKDYAKAATRAVGAVRLDPDRPVESAAALALPRHEWLIAYCA